MNFAMVMLYVALGCLALFALITDKRMSALEERISKQEKYWNDIGVADDDKP